VLVAVETRVRKRGLEMKIVTAKEFLQMPANTLYSKYSPCCMGALEIKGDNVGEIDYYSQQIVDAIDCSSSSEFIDGLLDAQENGTALKMDFNCEGRDGLFDMGQLYAVWDNDDVKGLIARLTFCVSV